jgi:transketolase
MQLEAPQGNTVMAPTHRMADAIRFLSMDAIERVGEGHPGTPLGAAEICTALFARHLKFNPDDPHWFDRDRFVLSNGHGSMLLYALLHLGGYAGIGIEDIRRFRELGSPCEGHPERATARGIEVTTGPLGQGIANAAGMALAEAFLAARLGTDLVDHRTYALVGDGCLQEGVAHEVASLAGHLRLGKLCWLWDDNLMTDDGAIGLAASEDMPARFRAAHWHVQEVDGHDVEAVSAALLLARAEARPSFIACRTVIGRGLPGIEGTRAAHSGRLTREITDAARAALGWGHAAFAVPDDVAHDWREAGRRSLPEHAAWQARVAGLEPGRRRELDRLREGRLPEGWQDGLREFATRTHGPQPGWKLSGELQDIAAAAIPELLSGAPDLEGATQHKRSLGAFTPANPQGRYVHYGVREHAMGAMLNGMAAHGGVVPTGITYMVFSDYLRPTLRLAAMMRLPVCFAFSHDSIGIGRNGPTHQPVEYLAALRAIPDMWVLRPADAVEAAECWELALARRDGPSCLVFARQPLQPTGRAAGENRSARGAYVLVEAACGPRQATLLATGSEVGLAMRARAVLEARGTATAVVSMPCWELFEAQDMAYRASVLGPGTRRVGIEAAVRLGWDRWIGEDGVFIGMTGFGASGAETELWSHFGLTEAAVVAAVPA